MRLLIINPNISGSVTGLMRSRVCWSIEGQSAIPQG